MDQSTACGQLQVNTLLVTQRNAACLLGFLKWEKSLNPFPGKDRTLKNFENLMGCLFLETYYITNSFKKKMF
jgi:hypothetical protein